MTKYTNDTSFEGVNSARAAQDFEEVNSWGYQSSKNNTNGTPNSLYLNEENNVPLQISIPKSKEDADQFTVTKIEIGKGFNLCSFIRVIRHFSLEYLCR